MQQQQNQSNGLTIVNPQPCGDMTMNAANATNTQEQVAGRKAELSAELQQHAETIGNAIGEYSKNSRVFAEAMRGAGIILLSMDIPEGVVGNPWPEAELFLFTIRAKAWAAGPESGKKMVLKDDQVLANALSGLRKIARAATLGGHIKQDDGTVIRDAKGAMMRVLQRSGDAAGSGFHPAVRLAKDYEKRAKVRARTDAEFARLIGFDTAKSDKGRPKAEPSDSRVDAAVDMVKACGVANLDKVVTAALSSMTTQANTAEAQAKVNALLNKALALVKEAETIINESRALQPNKPLASLEAAIRATQQGGGTTAPTHTDEITSKRKERKARRSRKAVQSESTSEPVAAQA